MELIEGESHNRDCMVASGVAMIRLFTSYWGGWALTVVAVGDAYSIGCFD